MNQIILVLQGDHIEAFDALTGEPCEIVSTENKPHNNAVSFQMNTAISESDKKDVAKYVIQMIERSARLAYRGSL